MHKLTDNVQPSEKMNIRLHGAFLFENKKCNILPKRVFSASVTYPRFLLGGGLKN
jgi:hypothetical protein